MLGEIQGGVVANRTGAKASFLIGVIVKIGSLIMLIYSVEPWMFFLFSALNGLSVTLRPFSMNH
ncbi:hypothetical protein [Bacillus pinisoli]|uniref:hypothetical protein n=1 Tax=Bacillus pinisoli TaxID=2901866 RepID=UPI001FF15567|nr:hypothetical protein [Bacillus pinisoli]